MMIIQRVRYNLATVIFSFPLYKVMFLSVRKLSISVKTFSNLEERRQNNAHDKVPFSKVAGCIHATLLKMDSTLNITFASVLLILSK